MKPTPPAIEPERIFMGLSWRIIIRGALLDIVLTVIVTLPLYLYYAGSDFFSLDPAVADRATETAYRSFTFNFLSLVLGLLCTVIAAYWASRRAGSRHVPHGGWVAVVSMLLVVPFMFVPGVLDLRQPIWVEVAGLSGMLPAGMLGGYIAAQRSRSAA
jgi:ABC-type sulfate transport system permease component